MGCTQQALTLVEGVDYEVDLVGGRIRFLSTGQLGTLADSASFCGVKVQVCCQDAGCTPGGAYACDMGCYVNRGYQTVMQQGAENYRGDDEKMIKMVGVEAEPLAQSTPSIITTEVGYAATPNCFTWKPTKNLDFACQTELSAAQHVARRTRPDGTFYFPCWRRGRYLSTRFIIDGIGGLGTFSAMTYMIKKWGQQDSP